MDASLQSRAEELAGEIASQAKTAEDLKGLMRLMMKSALERMLDTEMDVHLGRKTLPRAADQTPAERPTSTESASPPASSAKRSSNRRNGRSRKTVRGDLGELTIATPRDRKGTFEPQLIGKHQRRLPGFDEKILALYAKGMTTEPTKRWQVERGACCWINWRPVARAANWQPSQLSIRRTVL